MIQGFVALLSSVVFWNLLCCVIVISSQTTRTQAFKLSVWAVRSDKLKMGLDKSRIPKLSDSSRKFIPERQRKAMNDPYVERIRRTRTDKGKKVSGIMVETRSQKSSEGHKARLEVEVQPDPAVDENQQGKGPEGRGNKRLVSESTPVEQGQDFATSTGTLDREEMSELSDISTENVETKTLPTDKTMMLGVTEKPARSSSFSEREKNPFGNFFPFTMGTGTSDEAETHEEEEDDDEQDNFGSQVSLNSSTQENDAYTDRETGTMNQFGVVRTLSKIANGSSQSIDFVNMANSKMRTSKNRNSGLCDAPADPEVDLEKTSRQRIKTRVWTSTKLPGIDRVTPPLVTPLVDNGRSIEEALTNIVCSIGEQNEQMSLRMSKLERAGHVERENLREEINRNRQEVFRSEKRLKERTDEHLAKNLSRMTREAEQRELRLREDMEKLRIQQEQTLGTLDTKIDAMMERRTQAIMDRLDRLLGSRNGSKDGESKTGEPAGSRG